MITIVLPISREDYLNEIFNSLSLLKRPADTELLIIVDGDTTLRNVVDKKLDSISFRAVKVIHHTHNPATTINERRYRIAELHNLARRHISEDASHVFLIEDDTTYPPDTLEKMLRVFTDAKTGYVEGVELGRHITPYVGAWKVNSLSEPTRVESAIYREGFNHTEPIDAGGLYCCLVRADLYREHYFKPFDTVGTNGLSCDVNFGLAIRRKGYNCYLDWSIKCDHLTEKGPINVGNTEPKQVVFEKQNQGWKARTVNDV